MQVTKDDSISQVMIRRTAKGHKTSRLNISNVSTISEWMIPSLSNPKTETWKSVRSFKMREMWFTWLRLRSSEFWHRVVCHSGNGVSEEPLISPWQKKETFVYCIGLLYTVKAATHLCITPNETFVEIAYNIDYTASRIKRQWCKYSPLWDDHNVRNFHKPINEMNPSDQPTERNLFKLIDQLAPDPSQITKNELTNKLDTTDSNQAAHLNC
jgi:hypothetical protein